MDAAGVSRHPPSPRESGTCSRCNALNLQCTAGEGWKKADSDHLVEEERFAGAHCSSHREDAGGKIRHSWITKNIPDIKISKEIALAGPGT